jgi:uncharacterized protein YbjT (DUF2867 family)
MILVTGATGKVGRELVNNLLEYEANFKVMCRDPSRATKFWSKDEVDVVKGDFNDPKSLNKALNGVDILFLLSPGNDQMEVHQLNMIQEAERANVHHIVKLSSLGAGVKSQIRLCRVHRKIEQKIEKSGMAWTHLRPNFFFNKILNHKKTFRTEGKIYAPARKGKASMIDVRDVALVAATVLTEAGHEEKTYELTGKEALSFAEAARTITSVTGRNIIYIPISIKEARKRMIDEGTPDWLLEDRISLYRIWAGNDVAMDTKVVFSLTRKTPYTFRQFVQDYEDDFFPED